MNTLQQVGPNNGLLTLAETVSTCVWWWLHLHGSVCSKLVEVGSQSCAAMQVAYSQAVTNTYSNQYSASLTISASYSASASFIFGKSACSDMLCTLLQ